MLIVVLHIPVSTVNSGLNGVVILLAHLLSQLIATPDPLQTYSSSTTSGLPDLVPDTSDDDSIPALEELVPGGGPIELVD